jgi:hypothetical protein
MTQTTITALAALLMTGCPIWWDEFGSGGTVECTPEGCTGECNEDDDCPDGYYCDGSECVPSGFCSFGCPPGMICDEERDTCVPPESCNDDDDCTRYPGYCDEEEGVCVATGECSDDDDCAPYGESFVCDEGVCRPDEGPCPSGHCGCVEDADCDGSMLCENGLCYDPAGLCVFDHQCGAGQRCLNSFCRVDCSAGAPCPTGQVCDGMVCIDDVDGGGACLYSSDCGSAQSCVNGYCLDQCSVDDDCGYYAHCASGLCRPDEDRLETCETAGCSDLDCVDDACRAPCDFAADCDAYGIFTECVAGHCYTVNELISDCSRGRDCSSSTCLDGICQ